MKKVKTYVTDKMNVSVQLESEYSEKLYLFQQYTVTSVATCWVQNALFIPAFRVAVSLNIIMKSLYAV